MYGTQAFAETPNQTLQTYDQEMSLFIQHLPGPASVPGCPYG